MPLDKDISRISHKNKLKNTYQTISKLNLTIHKIDNTSWSKEFIPVMQNLTQTNVIHHVKISEKCHIITIDSEKLFDKNINFVRNSQTRNKKNPFFILI